MFTDRWRESTSYREGCAAGGEKGKRGRRRDRKSENATRRSKTEVELSLGMEGKKVQRGLGLAEASGGLKHYSISNISSRFKITVIFLQSRRVRSD